jgi:hypothetical protein
MSRQDQRVAEGGTAIQAGGAVTVSHGMSPAQMTEIMVGLASQLQQFHADAERKAQERFETFHAEILEQFAKPGEANPEAFRDPDFQFLLASAQASYARTGDDDIGDILVKLLAERSMQSGRNRLTLVLNQAAETVTRLTADELAIVSVAFILFDTGAGATNYREFVTRFESFVAPFVVQLDSTVTPYEYLQSLGCISIGTVISRDLGKIFIDEYGGFFTDGFSEEELTTAIANEIMIPIVKQLVTVCFHDQTKLQFSNIAATYLLKELEKRGLPSDLNARIIKFYNEKTWDKSKLVGKLTADCPAFAALEKLWPTCRIKDISLTSLGKALGHANIIRLAPQFSH